MFFASLPIKDESSLLLFAKFFEIFIASITWKKNAFSFSFLPIKDRSWCRFSARISKNIFSHLVETAISVANDANAFEYSIARTGERPKSSSIALRYINISKDAIFPQEI